MNSDDELYRGNNATDYQPPTGNPQSTGTNLQPGATGLPLTETQQNISQQRLPAVDSLRVIIVKDGSGATNTRLTPAQTATQTWVGPFWGSVLLGIIIVIVWAVRILAKEEAPKLSEALEEAIKEPILAEEAALDAPVTPVKKKKSAKKKSKKK